MTTTSSLTPALTTQEVRRWTRVGVLAALAMLLSYAEAFVPIPVPGVKLGLANIAVLAALVDGDIAGAFCISAIKVLAVGLLFGSPLTMAYSVAGTMLAFAGMAPLSRLRSMHVAMLSIVGALLHEVGQLLVAQLLLGTTTVWYLAPVLLVAGCVTGAICGVLASKLDKSLRVQEVDVESNAVRPIEPKAHPCAIWSLLLLFALVALILHVSDLRILVAACTLSILACLLLRIRPASLLRSVVPLLPLALFTFFIQYATAPQTALGETARALLRLASIAAICSSFAKRVPANEMSSTIGWIVGPLRRLGVRTDGFVFAFDVAIRLVPTMSELIVPSNIRLKDVPQLVPRAYARLMEQANTSQ